MFTRWCDRTFSGPRFRPGRWFVFNQASLFEDFHEFDSGCFLGFIWFWFFCLNMFRMFLTMFVLFINMFGEPSLKRFFKEDVTKTISSEEVEGGMLLPAITLCPANNRTMTGWKDGRVQPQDGFENFLEKECNSSTVEELFECITEKTYTEEESILKTTVSTQPLASKVKPVGGKELVWTKDLTASLPGNCFTIEYNLPIGDGYIEVLLNDSMKYYLFIHDRDFFVVNNNTLALSKEFLIIDCKFHIDSMS